MKLALHRSITFWSGLLGMGFVCWGWWDSTRQVQSGGYKDWLVVNTESRVAVGHIRMGKPGWFGSPLPVDLETSQRMRLASPRWLRHAGGEFWSEENPIRIIGVTEELDPDEFWLFLGKSGDWQIFVPHWIVLLAVCIPLDRPALLARPP